MDSHLSEKIKELWTIGWEIRAMVILSLSLQIVLVLFANRQKYTTRKWLRNFVWLAYVSADWVAITALGILARSQGDPGTTSKSRNLIPAFWAPILLVHLGGPDAITAYQMEDNELWLRHLLTLATQVSLTFYFLFLSWGKDTLTFIGITVLVSGTIKYGERVCAFWHASSEKFKASAIQELMTGVMELYEQFRADQLQLLDLSNASIDDGLNNMTDNFVYSDDTTIPQEVKYLAEAHFLFPMLTLLFADLPLIFPQHVASYRMLKAKNASEAFKLIEVELGFMHNMLYTKATRASSLGIILHSISFLSSVFALAAFTKNMDKHPYSKIDTLISQILLVGAIFLEIYAVIMLPFSGLVSLSIAKARASVAGAVFLAICPTRFMFPCNDKRWSRSMAQRNLLDECYSRLQYRNRLMQYPCLIHERTVMMCYFENAETWKDVDVHLKELIFRQLLDKRSRYDPGAHDFTVFSENLLAERGDGVLREKQSLEKFGWSLTDIEFDHSLILWHVATDLCYHDDLQKVGDINNLHSNCEISKRLADYMLYLMVNCPSMMPKGFSEVRYRLTVSGALQAVVNEGEAYVRTIRRTDVSNVLLQKYCSGSMGFSRIQDRTYRISDCCKLAKSLQSLEMEDGWTNEQMWEIISQVWVEMLTYAASRCGWKEHAQKLNQGGELITHVCLLMAHLGLNKQCRKEVFFVLPMPLLW